MTIHAAIADATGRLRQAGSPTPRLDAEVLLAHAIGRDRSWLLAHSEASIDDVAAFQALIDRRAAGEPVAYIRGFKDWHSLRIRTDARALIPRPETELLADAAAAEIRARLERGSVVAWDVATGTGAVAIVLALQFANALAARTLTLIASDVSADALALARENIDGHAVGGIVLLEADLLDGSAPPPDVVIANLPYVSSAEVDERQGSLGFEPRIALDGGRDGLDLLRRMLAEAAARTADGATILLEIGVGQVEAIRALSPEGAAVQVVPDLSGLDRVVRLDLHRLAE